MTRVSVFRSFMQTINNGCCVIDSLDLPSVRQILSQKIHIRLIVLRLGGWAQTSGVFVSPVGGKAARAGGDKDGLAKAFEQDGNLGQPLLAGVHLAQQLLQLSHHLPLLAERCEANRNAIHRALRELQPCRAVDEFMKIERIEKMLEILI